MSSGDRAAIAAAPVAAGLGRQPADVTGHAHGTLGPEVVVNRAQQRHCRPTAEHPGAAGASYAADSSRQEQIRHSGNETPVLLGVLEHPRNSSRAQGAAGLPRKRLSANYMP